MSNQAKAAAVAADTRAMLDATPDCGRCGHPCIGPRAIGAAFIAAGVWVCGYCATPAEHQQHLANQLAADHG